MAGRSTEEENFFNQPSTATKNKLTTDSILALYGNTSSKNTMAANQFKGIISNFLSCICVNYLNYKIY